MQRRVTLWLAVAVFICIGVLPIAVMLVRSLFVDGELSSEYYRDLFFGSSSWPLARNSLLLASLTTLFTTTLGVPLGVLFGKTNLPGRNWLTALFIIPFLLPPYINAISWSHLVSREGLLAEILGAPVAEAASQQFFGLMGCIWVLTISFLPIPMLLTMVYLRGIPSRLEEAARLSARWPTVLSRVTLPLIVPGVTAGAVLVFLLASGELSVPSFLRYRVFPLLSFTEFTASYNFGAAAAAAAPLVAGVILILGAERALVGEGFSFGAPTSGELLRIPLGGYRWPVLGLTLLLLFLTVISPLVSLIAEAASVPLLREALARAGDAALRSIGFAAMGATGLTVLGFLLGYLIQRRESALWRTVDYFALVTFTLPGVVTGIGLISVWNTPFTQAIYGTAAIILFGYIAQYTAVTARLSAAALSHIPVRMEEAAQLSGAGWFRRIAQIVLPLSGRGLGLCWLVAFLFCLRDAGLSLLVAPPGLDTLPARILTLMANGSSALIAAVCLLMIVSTLVPLGIIALVLRRLRGIE